MALYQPTNVIPSSYTKGTVDAVKDNMEISWQVNGNSAMTAFQIDFYLNDANSTYVTSTGRLTDNCPFYGTDRFGRPQFFTWNKGQSWDEAYGFTNGNEYKYKITQFFKGENNVIKCQANIALSVGNTYYFKIPDSNAIVYFSVSSNLVVGTNDIYYSYTNNDIWVDNRSRIVLCSGNYVENGTIPSGAIEVRGDISATRINELFVTQTSSNVFFTRSMPTLTIYRSNEQYSNEIDLLDNQSITTNTVLAVGSTNYFSFDSRNESGEIITSYAAFTVEDNAISNDTIIFYNVPDNKCYYYNDENKIELQVTVSQTQPTMGYDLSKAVINLKTSIGFFKAIYAQLQDDPIRWIRWQVATATYNSQTDKWILGDILQDTGDIYTPTLNFEFNGFFNGQQYAIRAIGESESGQETKLQGTDEDGWIYSTINIENRGKYDGNFNVQCLNRENATLLEWEGVEVIPPTKSPQGYEPQISNSSVTLLPKNGDTEYSVTWDNQIIYNKETKQNETIPMNFAPDWTAVWKGKVRKEEISSTEITFSGTTQRVDKIENFTVQGRPTKRQGTENQRIEGVTNSNLRYKVTKPFPAERTIIRIRTFMKLPANPAVDGNYAQRATWSFDNENHTFTVEIEALAHDAHVWLDIDIVYSEFVYTETKTFDYDVVAFQVLSTSSGVVNYDITFEGKQITFVLYGSNSNTYISASIAATLALSYEVEVPHPFLGKLQGYSEVEKSTNVESYTVSFANDIATVKIFASSVTQVFVILGITTSQDVIFLSGKIFEVGQTTISTLSLSAENENLILQLGETALSTIAIPNNVIAAAISINPLTVNAFFYDINGLITKSSVAITYTQQPITSVSIFGGDNGAIIDGVSIYQGNGSNILSLYENPDFEPVWNSPDYELYMTANFNGNLEGGTGTATGSGFRVYRQEVGKDFLTPIATVPSTVTSVKDYGIVSRKAYKYSLYAYDNNGAFMSAVENEKVVATCFKNYSLLVCDYDEENDEYHVRKQYLFALNLSTGSVGNNNSPTLNANFTRYPTRMPSTQNYASGTLQGLIGAIYTVPALIEQIGNYKWTAKPSTLDYFDSVDLEQELYDLSTAPYQLFLRDMKGRLRMIATNSAITMTTNIKQKQQSISISFPWVEIGDASDVTIIQTPDDYGWNNDNQVLDVLLDVDVNTGELSATYPYPYNGTKFYLTGVNKETLTAKTPLGITPAQFNLSETASESDDGELTAMVKVNSEDN